MVPLYQYCPRYSLVDILFSCKVLSKGFAVFGTQFLRPPVRPDAAKVVHEIEFKVERKPGMNVEKLA